MQPRQAAARSPWKGQNDPAAGINFPRPEPITGNRPAPADFAPHSLWEGGRGGRLRRWGRVRHGSPARRVGSANPPLLPPPYTWLVGRSAVSVGRISMRRSGGEWRNKFRPTAPDQSAKSVCRSPDAAHRPEVPPGVQPRAAPAPPHEARALHAHPRAGRRPRLSAPAMKLTGSNRPPTPPPARR